MPCQGEYYLTVAHSETGQRLRLKGTSLSRRSRSPSFAVDLKEKEAEDQEAIRDHRQQIQDTAKEEIRGLARELGETSTRDTARDLKRIASATRTDHRRTARMLAWL